MKALFLIITIVLFFTGCASYQCCDQTAKASQPQSMQKNPISVAFYKENEKPKAPYKVIGKETVSKYNIVGIKRQEASIHDAMRSLAASMGGDAVIDVKHDDKTVSGTVIGFENTANHSVALSSVTNKS